VFSDRSAFFSLFANWPQVAGHKRPCAPVFQKIMSRTRDRLQGDSAPTLFWSSSHDFVDRDPERLSFLLISWLVARPLSSVKAVTAS
jgi:hypothetical protein